MSVHSLSEKSLFATNFTDKLANLIENRAKRLSKNDRGFSRKKAFLFGAMRFQTSGSRDT